MVTGAASARQAANTTTSQPVVTPVRVNTGNATTFTSMNVVHHAHGPTRNNEHHEQRSATPPAVIVTVSHHQHAVTTPQSYQTIPPPTSLATINSHGHGCHPRHIPRHRRHCHCHITRLPSPLSPPVRLITHTEQSHRSSYRRRTEHGGWSGGGPGATAGKAVLGNALEGWGNNLRQGGASTRGCNGGGNNSSGMGAWGKGRFTA